MAQYLKIRVFPGRLAALEVRSGNPLNPGQHKRAHELLAEHFPEASGQTMTDEGLFLDLAEPVRGTPDQLEARRAACEAALRQVQKK